MEVWDEGANVQAFKAIFDQLVKNYEIICQNSWDNNLMEALTGKVALDSLATTLAEHKEEDTNDSEVEFDEANEDK